MKIIKLKSENIKKLRAVEITPDGNIVQISGKNGQGKSSVLDSILYALAGEKYIPSKPIRDGEKRAEIEIDLGELKVYRSFTEGNTYLKVVTKDGFEINKGQTKLSQMVKNISFDPLEFSRLRPKDQKERLLQLLGIDVSELEKKHAEVYEERKVIGQMGERAKGELETIGDIDPENKKLKEVNVSELHVELSEIETQEREITQLEKFLSGHEEEIKELESRLQDYKNSYTKYKAELDKAQKTFSPAKKTELEEKIESASEVNAKVREVTRHTEAKKKVDQLRLEYKEKTEELKNIQTEKENLLSTVKMPLGGLGVEESGITFDGIPYEQLSTSEKIKVSFSIAMASEPELKFIRVMDGSLLDSESLKVISDMANEKDFQVWMEIVDDSGEVGFYIEDGAIK